MARPPAPRAAPRRLRSWRILAGALAAVGAAGAILTAVGEGGRTPATEVAARFSPPATLPPLVPTRATPPPPGPAAPPEPAVPRSTRRVRLRVEGTAGPEPDVAVRVLDHVSEESCFRSLSSTVRTDEGGWAELAVALPTPDDAVVEVARADASGFRHGFVPLRGLLPADGEPGTVRLPVGGELKIAVEGLPPERMPAHLDVEFLSPYADCEELFRDVAVSPSEDGGIFEVRPGWRRMRVRLRPDGTAGVRHVPSDHAVTVLLPEVPEGWLVEGTSSTGPLLPGRDADFLRVPEGQEATYRLRLRRAPFWRVVVRGEDGAPVAGARLASGLTNLDGNRRLLGHTATADAQGAADLPLWTGGRLPDWTPPRLLLVAWSARHTARLQEAPGAWNPAPAEVVLAPDPGGRFALEGKILHEEKRPGAGLPVRLACAEPWNGQVALDGFATTTDGDGRFRFEVPEALRPVFAAGPGLRVYLDADRLESMPSNAYWRLRWPHLPRAHLAPRVLPLPARGASSHVTLQVEAP